MNWESIYFIDLEIWHRLLYGGIILPGFLYYYFGKLKYSNWAGKRKVGLSTEIKINDSTTDLLFS